MNFSKNNIENDDQKNLSENIPKEENKNSMSRKTSGSVNENNKN